MLRYLTQLLMPLILGLTLLLQPAQAATHKEARQLSAALSKMSGSTDAKLKQVLTISQSLGWTVPTRIDDALIDGKWKTSSNSGMTGTTTSKSQKVSGALGKVFKTYSHVANTKSKTLPVLIALGEYKDGRWFFLVRKDGDFALINSANPKQWLLFRK